MADRNEHAAEIEAVHHQAGRGAMQRAGGIRPFRPRQRDDDAEEDQHADHPQRQIRQRLGVAEAKLCANKARRPQQHKHGRRREDGEILERTRHSSWPGGSASKSAGQSKIMELQTAEETVTLTELMRSVQHDVVKVRAHTHQLGVAAEYEWKDADILIAR
jgi:hypothetical protein